MATPASRLDTQGKRQVQVRTGNTVGSSEVEDRERRPASTPASERALPTPSVWLALLANKYPLLLKYGQPNSCDYDYLVLYNIYFDTYKVNRSLKKYKLSGRSKLLSRLKRYFQRICFGKMSNQDSHQGGIQIKDCDEFSINYDPRMVSTKNLYKRF